MYSDIFSKIYDAFGWNYYPESFAQLLLRWIDEQGYISTICLIWDVAPASFAI